MSFGQRRRLAAHLEPAPELKPGNRVQSIVTTASPSGLNDVPQSTAARARDDNMVPAIGPHRGKAKKTAGKKKGMVRAISNLSNRHQTSTQALSAQITSEGKLADPDAFMASL